MTYSSAALISRPRHLIYSVHMAYQATLILLALKFICALEWTLRTLWSAGMLESREPCDSTLITWCDGQHSLALAAMDKRKS
jgi:hypothetical protein